MKPKLLLVEDEIDLGNVVKQYLEVMDFEVDWCINGKDAFDKFRNNPDLYQLLLIDVCLPEMDGFELAFHVTGVNEKTSFLFLTARNEKQDRLQGLKIGADDYITKPFDVDELVLRIKNIIRRRQGFVTMSAQKNGIEIGNIRFYKESLKLIVSQKETTLTPREAELLDYLFKNPNQVLKREDLLIKLWGENDYFLGRSLDVFISRLRKHLANNEYATITNIYGVGFVFNIRTNKNITA